jgi:hypothetical protein
MGIEEQASIIPLCCSNIEQRKSDDQLGESSLELEKIFLNQEKLPEIVLLREKCLLLLRFGEGSETAFGGKEGWQE